MATFSELLGAQIKNEFAASQQYAAVAVWFARQDLPQLARYFYLQSLEERNHAMMMVQYMLDRDIPVTIPGIDAVSNDFTAAIEPIALALAQEKQVTSDIEALFTAARSEGNPIGEQFMLWFLKEQVEEVASMTTLLNVAERAGQNLFDLENYVAREQIGDGGHDTSAPQAAGGAL